jgi:hypothetical protein
MELLQHSVMFICMLTLANSMQNINVTFQRGEGHTARRRREKDKPRTDS